MTAWMSSTPLAVRRSVEAERCLHGHVGRVPAAVEHPSDVGTDLGPGGDHQDEVAPHDRSEVVHGEHVGGIRRGHHGDTVLVADDHHIVMTGRGLGDGPRLGEVDPDGVQVHELEAQLLGHAPHEIGLGDQLLGGEDAGDALSGAIVLLEHGLHVLERDPLAVDEGLGQRRKHGCPGGDIQTDLAEILLGLLLLKCGHGFGDEIGGQRGRVAVWRDLLVVDRLGQFGEIIGIGPESTARRQHVGESRVRPEARKEIGGIEHLGPASPTVGPVPISSIDGTSCSTGSATDDSTPKRLPSGRAGGRLPSDSPVACTSSGAGTGGSAARSSQSALSNARSTALAVRRFDLGSP